MSAAPDRELPVTVTRVAGVVAFVVTLTLPLGYFSAGYTALSSKANTEAAVARSIVSRLISSGPDTWKFQQYRLTHMLTHDLGETGEGLARVLDIDGNLVIEVGKNPDSPVLRRTTSLYDSGQVVGRVELSHSLRGLVLGTALAALLGLALAAAVFVALRVLPLRALRRAMDALSREKERAEVTLRSIGDGVITTDALERIEFLNPVAEKLTGWSSEDARNRPLNEVFRLVNELTDEPLASPMQKALAEKRIVALENQAALVQRNGHRLSIEDDAAPILDGAGNVLGGVLVFHDVSKARELTQQLTWQASHDSLTGLINRAEFEVNLEHALHTARNEAKRHVLCYIDLDQFKIVNDTCGHSAGDALLKQVAQLLQSKVRARDTLARLGGDEFGVLLEACPMEQGQRIISELLAAVGEYRFTWEGKVFSIGASIGVAPVTTKSLSVSTLLADVDAACYSAKEGGRNRMHVLRYEDVEQTPQREQMGWVSIIHEAIELNRFVLYYQPYLRLSAGSRGGTHIEVLLRMLDAKGELIPPGKFIPAAERYNVMTQIDRWVIRKVFENASRLGNSFEGKLTCAVNLSGQSLSDPYCAAFILEQARIHKIDCSGFNFEITETAAINQLHEAIKFIKLLKTHGFGFALDDFGSGLSSFGYLKNLPVDMLKIDGALIRGIATDKVAHTMVSAIDEIGHSMGLLTVAEMVDSAEVLKALRSIGVDYAQGYLIAKPAPLFSPALASVLPRVAGI